jgi:hypothetical protein
LSVRELTIRMRFWVSEMRAAKRDIFIAGDLEEAADALDALDVLVGDKEPDPGESGLMSAAALRRIWKQARARLDAIDVIRKDP